MFANRYFAPRYFAPRYFPPVDGSAYFGYFNRYYRQLMAEM